MKYPVTLVKLIRRTGPASYPHGSPFAARGDGVGDLQGAQGAA